MLRSELGLRTFSSLSRADGVVHAFAAADAFSDFDAARDEHRERLRRELAPDGSLTLVRTRQTHSGRVARVSFVAGSVRSDLDFDESGIDGLVTTESGLLLHAISADCPLLFLASRAGRGVAIAHCGWRGVAAGIVEETVSRLRDASESTEPERMIAAISPGARSCCYEVGDEVVAAIERRGVSRDEFVVPYQRGDGSRSRAIALDRAIRRLLVSCGVALDAIESASECSICGGAAFHSHRRNGAKAGRMSGVIAMTNERTDSPRA